jgi:hypothetical protein
MMPAFKLKAVIFYVVLMQIPYIKQALNLTEGKLRLFGSPWSAPYWMKTDHNMTGNGSLIGQPGGPYFKAWANYFVKYGFFFVVYIKDLISPYLTTPVCRFNVRTVAGLSKSTRSRVFPSGV